MEILSLIVGVFDKAVLPWVFVLNILGFWLKKIKTPKWLPPLPVLLFCIAFLIMTLFGWIFSDTNGVKAFAYCLLYGLGNAILTTLLATFFYDVVHQINKRRTT